MLLSSYGTGKVEAGCDEAGRGCLAGPVVAAAVVFNESYHNELLNDSKKLSQKQRCELRRIVQKDAMAWAVAFVDNVYIDKHNILNASIEAMHRAITKLMIKPELLLIDGNKFKAYDNVPHQCIVKGDSKYLSIAAASILAKTYRDDYMVKIGHSFPEYHWHKNKGYPTIAHISACHKWGLTPFHRKSFQINRQTKINF